MPPSSFSTVSIDLRNATLSWTTPDGDLNGIIIGYTVTCANREGMVISTLTTTNFTGTIQGLNPYTLYMCNATASTSAGASPAAMLNFTTASGSELLREGHVIAVSA